ncbi:MAG: hypothetical protein IJX78_06710 [Bacilli bacterium]|nr:hypothetical protein [Bacilli bacterium]
MKTYTICGSMKFAEEMKHIANQLRSEKGYNVFECVYVEDISKLTAADIKKLQDEHYKKIDNSDGIYVVNINGYIGKSVKKEIEYAKKNNKEIVYYVNDINLIEFLIKAKISTYADGIKYKVPSTKPNSVDYHYAEDNYIYHDTYFGSKDFYGEEIVYFDNFPIWHMEYKGGVLNDESIDVYAKVLKPALKNVNSKLPLRGPKEFIDDDYKYTFETIGDLDSFKGIERIYKKDKLVYELICSGGNMEIKRVCDLLRKELYNNNYGYGFYCNGKKYKPNMNNGFDNEFYNLLLTIYKVQDPIDTMREKIGTCNDVVLVMKKILDEEKIVSKIWLLHKKVNNKVHTILTFNVSDKIVYLELTPQSNKPYYGKEIIYNKEDELKKEFQNQGYDVIDITNDIASGEYPEFSLKLLK